MSGSTLALISSAETGWTYADVLRALLQQAPLHKVIAGAVPMYRFVYGEQELCNEWSLGHCGCNGAQACSLAAVVVDTPFPLSHNVFSCSGSDTRITAAWATKLTFYPGT